MTDIDVITPDVVETIDYALRQTELLESIAIDIHAIVLILIFLGGSLIAYFVLKIIKSIICNF